MTTQDGGFRPAGNRPETDPSVDRFVMVPVDLLALVAAKKIGKEAAWLYVVLLSRHNRTRADDDVWPSRQTLADAMGLSKAKAVDKYIAELRGAGLIIAQRRTHASGMNTSNRLTLTLTVSVKDGQEARQSPVGDRLWTESPVGSTPQGTAAVPHRGSPQYPTGDRGSTPQGIGTKGSELDELDLDESNNILASHASRGPHDEVFDAEIVDPLDPWTRPRSVSTPSDWADPWADTPVASVPR